MWIKYITVLAFSAIISGMGIGGGSILILLSTIFNMFSQQEAQGYNLLMFVAVGISATITNLKSKNIDKNYFKKLIIPVCIGSIIGIIIVKFIQVKFLQSSFYVFMILIGTYEIISSLKSIICDKNNNGRN